MIIQYLRALLRHKYYVFQAGRKVGGIPLFRLIIHDWSKFLPSEFLPYARKFYGAFPKDHNDVGVRNYWYTGRLQPQVDAEFDVAWLHHLHLNPHHHQHWVLRQDEDGTKRLPMPETYVREMVADWMGASRAYTGSWDMTNWLSDNLQKNVEPNLHPATAHHLATVLFEQGYIVLAASLLARAKYHPEASPSPAEPALARNNP